MRNSEKIVKPLEDGQHRGQIEGSSQHNQEQDLQQQLNSEPTLKRCKRSDSIPELPESFKIGVAIGGGDCFFDAVAQGLKQLKPDMDFTVGSLRQVCKKFAQSQLENNQSWLKEALKNEAEPIDEYIPRIKFTAEDIKKKPEFADLKLSLPIWGRSEIEGIIICKEYNVKLHVIEKHNVEGKELWADQIVDESGSKSVDNVNYNEENTIHIVNRGNEHFEPIVKSVVQHSPSDNHWQLGSYRHILSDSSNNDQIRNKDELNADLINTIRGNDSEKEKKIEDLLNEGADVNNKNNNNETLVSIAERHDMKDIVKLMERPKRSPKKRVRTVSEENKPEDSDSKKKRISSTDHEPESEPSQHSSNRQENEEQRKCVGLLTSYHGIVYQIQWLMIVALESKNHGAASGFTFKTEVEDKDAGKFDDVVWQYKDDQQEHRYNFLQAKHKLDATQRITIKDLLKRKQKDPSKSDETDKRPFALEKYFISYRDKIKTTPNYQNKVENLIIVTNIDLDEKLKNSFEELEPESKIPVLEITSNSDTQNKEYAYYKLKKGNSFDKDMIERTLEGTYDLIKLAKRLGECVLKNQPTSLSRDVVLNPYSKVLEENVIQANKFRNNFISGQGLSVQINNLREAFFQEAFTNQRKSSNTDYKINNPKALADKIVFKVENSQSSAVKIERRLKIIKDNIDKLAGYVLIEKNGDIQFNPKFWKVSDNELPDDSLKVFRNTLKNSKKTVDELKEFKFKITDFETCKEILVDNDAFWEGVKRFSQFENSTTVTSSKDLPDYCLKDIEKDIEDFLNKLVFAVNYSKESLSKVVENKLGKKFRLINNEYIAHAFRVEIAKALDFTEGKFISTDKDVSQFFDKATQQIDRLIVIGPTLEYRAEIKEFGINFGQGAVNELKLGNFLTCKSDIQIFNVISEQNKLSAIKVLEILEGMPKYQKDDSYIFIRLSSLLRIQDRVVQAFKLESNNLLVIECDSAKNDVENLYENLEDIIKNKSSKKIVLITKQGDDLANKFKNDFSNKYNEENDKRNSLSDLNDGSQQKLLKKGEVIFQGKKVNLGTLVDNELKNLIDAEILSKLINNEKIEIGKALTDSNYDGVKDYYIDRTFNRHIVKIKEGFKEKKSKFFITDNDQVPESNLQQNQDIVLISNKVEYFTDLRNKHKERNIHWLKNDGKEFIWQQSYGVLSNLRDFIYTNEQSIQKYEPEKITDIPDRVVIIAAEPGIGKSTVLTHLALETKESNPSLWVVRINLLDQSSGLYKWQENNTENYELKAVKFLYRAMDFRVFRENGEQIEEEKEQMINNILELVSKDDNGEIALKINKERKIKGVNLLEVSLFYSFYNQGKIALLFDGFDEISPNYKNQVIKLLQVLKGTKAEKIWMTTRPYNIQSEPENKLGTFSYALKPFLRNEQKDFLKKFWGKKLKPSELDEQRSKVFIDELLTKFSESTNDQEMEFIGIPLQINMIAEIFLDEFKEFYSDNQGFSEENKQALSKKLNLVTLYEAFLNIVLERQLKKEHPDLDRYKPETERSIKKMHEIFMESHKKLAVYTMFEEDKLGTLLSKQEIEEVHVLIDKIEQAKEKTGIIVRIINGKPNFTHSTFAEYLAAGYLWEKFKSNQIDKFEENFIENIIIENLIKNDRIQICKFLQLITQKDLENNVDFFDKKDKLKTLLIKLVDKTYSYGLINYKNNKTSTKLLLKIIEFSLSVKEESDLEIIKNVQNLESHKKMALLSVSAKMGYIKLVNELGKEHNTEFLQHNTKFSTPLQLAAEKGHKEVVHSLIDNGAKVDATGNSSTTPLQLAAQNGHIEVVESLINSGAKVDTTGVSDWTPLHLAAENGHKKVVQSLINSGAKVDATDNRNWTPLQLAAKNGHKEIVQNLIKSGANVEATSVDNWKILYLVTKNGHMEGVPNLINSGAKVDAITDKSCTPLHLAAENGHTEVVQSLIKSGAKVDATSVNTFTALHLATKNGHKAIVQSLINSGANVDATSVDNWTPLHLAAKNGYKQVVKSLINSGAKVDATSVESWTPLYLATKNGHMTVVKSLIKSGAKVDATSIEGWKLLHLAAENGHMEVVQSLINGGAKVNATTDESCTALHLAAENGHMEVVQSLINSGVNVDATADGSCTPLHLAAVNGHMEVVQSLINNGANVDATSVYNCTPLYKQVLQSLIESGGKVDATDDRNWTPLHLASKNGHKEIVQSLINSSANVNVNSVDNWTPLHLAAENGHKEIVQSLINSSANIDVTSVDNWTPLHLAAENGHKEIVQSLINSSANIDVTSVDNWTPLHLAAKNGHKAIVQSLINSGANVDATTNESCTPLHLAAEYGHKEIVQSLINSSANVDATSVDNWTPLHKAAENGHKEVVQSLIKSGAKVDVTSFNSFTPLHLAARNGHMEVVNSLINSGAKVDATGDRNWTPLHLAAQNGHMKVVNSLINSGAKVDATDNRNWTPLHLAAENGHKEIVQSLINSSANVDATSVDNWTPLHKAAENGHKEVVQSLIKSGAKVDATSFNSFTPLHLAARNGHMEVVNSLINSGAKVDATGDRNWTPLHLAAQNGHMEVVNSLINSGAKVDATDNRNWTPLHLAAENGHMKVVHNLINSGAKVDATDNRNCTPLHLAAENIDKQVVKSFINSGAKVDATRFDNGETLRFLAKYGRLDVVKCLINSGAKVDASSVEGWKLLHLAAQYGHNEIVKSLINGGAKVDATDNRNWTPLHFAAINGNTDVVKSLIKSGAKVDATDNRNWTPLHLAAANGHMEVLQSLINSGAKVGATSVDNWTPLHKAAEYGHTQVVQRLINSGAKVDATINESWTPLHLAAKNGHEEVVQSLINSGANVDATSVDNCTPLHIAAQYGHMQVVRILINSGAKIDATINGNWTPLHIAARNGHMKVVHNLINSGAKIDATGVDNWTPLHKAAENGHKEVVQSLINRGAKVDATSVNSYTPLHLAAENGHKEVVRRLINSGAKSDATNNGNWTPLHIAARNGHMEVVQSLINSGAMVDATTDKSWTPLHLAERNGHMKVVNSLISGGAKVDATSVESWKLLHLAAQYGQNETVQSLINSGANVDATIHESWTPLHLAAKNGHKEVVQSLINSGANVDATSVDNCTPLHIAAQYGHMHVVRKLLNSGAKIDATINGNWTPLHIAARNGHMKVVHNLINSGAKIDATGVDNWTPLHKAAENGHKEVVQSLIKSGAKVDATSFNSFTPLHLAARNGHMEVVNSLINSGAKVDAIGDRNWTPLHRAAQHGHTEVVQSLINSGAKVDATTDESCTPLHLAAENGHKEVVRRLINSGAKVDAIGDRNWTPLHRAAQHGHTEVVQSLINSGAKVDATTDESCTPLHLAAENGHMEVVQSLINSGAKVDASIDKNWT